MSLNPLFFPQPSAYPTSPSLIPPPSLLKTLTSPHPTSSKEIFQHICHYHKTHHGFEPSEKNLFISTHPYPLLLLKELFLSHPWIIPLPAPWLELKQLRTFSSSLSFIDTSATRYKLKAKTLSHFLKQNPFQQPPILLLSQPTTTALFYTPQEFKALAKVCQEYELIILCNESQKLFPFYPLEAPSFHSYYPERTILIDEISFYLSHFLSCHTLIFGEALQEPLQQLQSLFPAFLPPYLLAPLLYLYNYPPTLQTYQYKIQKIFKTLSEETLALLQKEKLSALPSQGGFSLWLDFTPLKTTLEKINCFTSPQLKDKIQQEIGLNLIAASDFGLPPQHLLLILSLIPPSFEKAFNTWQQLTPTNIHQLTPYHHFFKKINDLIYWIRETTYYSAKNFVSYSSTLLSFH